MEALRFGLATFCPGPAATQELQHLRSLGVVPEGIPETVAVVTGGPMDAKLCLGSSPPAPEGSKADEAPTQVPPVRNPKLVGERFVRLFDRQVLVVMLVGCCLELLFQLYG